MNANFNIDEFRQTIKEYFWGKARNQETNTLPIYNAPMPPPERKRNVPLMDNLPPPPEKNIAINQDNSIIELLNSLPSKGGNMNDVLIEWGDVYEAFVRIANLSYDAGFSDSGEGWNGERPDGVTSTPLYSFTKAKSLRNIKF